MTNLFGTDVKQGFIFIYALIAIVLFLIVIIFIIDYYGKKKSLDNKKLNKTVRDLENESDDVVINTTVLDENHDNIVELSSLETINDNDEIYRDTDLEKTQAQIEIEEITKALKKAQEEEDRVDPYARFEEEQEQNAIISYKELHEKFDELYDESEKVQYMQDDNLPINIDELYKKNEEILNPPKVKMDDMNSIKVTSSQDVKFKNSPVISPVYGIQNEENTSNYRTPISDIEDDIRKTNEFLKILKDLQKNSN